MKYIITIERNTFRDDGHDQYETTENIDTNSWESTTWRDAIMQALHNARIDADNAAQWDEESMTCNITLTKEKYGPNGTKEIYISAYATEE